jgi:cysteine desulfurase
MIYFDNAATTLVDPKVLKIYDEMVLKYYANPSSSHIFGQETNHVLDLARKQILSSLKLVGDELIFTGGATESNNLALKGYAFRNKARGKHIIVSKVEHASILEAAKDLESNFGFEVTYLDVNKDGLVEIETLRNAIQKNTIIVSIMAVNNETGSINQIRKIAELLSGYDKIAFHVDAAQAIGKIELDYSKVDMITISAHKINGLKSSGALIKKKKIQLLPLFSGGGQENNLRSGTNDVALACALAKAVRIANENIKNHYEHVLNLSIELRNWISLHPKLTELNSTQITNPYIVNFSLLSKKASVVVEALARKGIMVSSVSACSSRHEPSSYVIEAMGKDLKLAKNTIRVSFSHLNTINEVKVFINTLEEILGEIR